MKPILLFIASLMLLSAPLYGQRQPVKCLTPEHIHQPDASKMQKLARIASSNSLNSPTGRFVIHYETTGTDAIPTADLNNNGIPDYAEKTAQYADESWQRTIGYGFPDPLTGSSEPYPIFLESIGNAYGYIQGTNANPHGTFMAINSDFEGFNPDLTIDELIQVTVAHEFKHVVQDGQTGLRSTLESTYWREFDAVLMEDVVYDDANDFYLFINTSISIFGEPDVPVRPESMGELGKGYYKMTFNHYFYDKYGIQFWVDVWERIEADNRKRFIDAISEELEVRGDTWPEEFARMFAWHMVTDDEFQYNYGFPERRNFPNPDIKYSLGTNNVLSSNVLQQNSLLAQTAADLYQLKKPFPSSDSYVAIFPNTTDVGSVVLQLNPDRTVNELLTAGDYGYHFYPLNENNLDQVEFAVVNTNPTNTARYDLIVGSADSYELFTWGDANGDQSVGVADASAVLQFLVDSDAYGLTGRNIAATDVSGNFQLTPFDASLIFDQAASGGIFSAVDDDENGSGPDVSFFDRTTDVVVKSGQVHAIQPRTSNQVLELPLERATGQTVRSVYLELSITADGFQYQGFDASGINAPVGSLVEAAFDAETGRFKLAIVFSQPFNPSYLGDIEYTTTEIPSPELILGYFDERPTRFKMEEGQLLSVDDEINQQPVDFVLDQNYPNPFNPSTRITFEIPNSSRVRIDVLNAVGQRVATVTDQMFTSGRHEVSFNASGMASGIYTYVLQADGVQLRRNMTLLK